MKKVTLGSGVMLPRYFHVLQILGLILLFLGVASHVPRFESRVSTIFPSLANLWTARSVAGLGILLLVSNGYRIISWLYKRRGEKTSPDQPSRRVGKTDASLFLPKNRFKVFVALLLTSPIFLAISPSIQSAKDQSMLRDVKKFQTTSAEVMQTREAPGTHGGFQARYRFQVASHPGWFTCTDSFGRSDLWSKLSHRDEDKINQGSRVIMVKYLPQNPAANEPYDLVGNPYADDITGAGLVLFLSTLWGLVGIGLVRSLFKPEPREG